MRTAAVVVVVVLHGASSLRLWEAANCLDFPRKLCYLVDLMKIEGVGGGPVLLALGQSRRGMVQVTPYLLFGNGPCSFFSFQVPRGPRN